MAIFLRLLGTVRVCQGAEAITDEPSGRAASLLAYLGCHLGEPVRRETLVSVFWPQSDSDSARKSLRVLLTQVRKMLGQTEAVTYLQGDYHHLQMDKALVTTDVARFLAALQTAQRVGVDAETEFCALTEAVENYAGLFAPYLDDEWVVKERQRLNDLFVNTALRLANLLRERQQGERAIAIARRTIEAEPLREEGHELLMQLYIEIGRPAAARNHYTEMERLFKNALGTFPSARVRATLKATPPTETTPHSPIALTPTRKYHLPLALDPILGRAKEIAEVQALVLEGNRLVTIKGFGGTGKTRLAREVAEQIARQNIFGIVVWVSLADVTDGAQIANTMLSSLPPPAKKRVGAESRSTEEQLVERLLETSIVLVLDNLEHLPDKPLHALLRLLLTEVPTLALLTTSRRRLRLSGEQVYFLSPLALPKETASREAQLENASVQLFLSRARHANPHFSIENGTLTSVNKLCHALEGLPLAIEMAAARVRVLSPDRILARLEKRFDLLVNQNTDMADRHRSLHATLQWSYDLLSPDAQYLLRAASIFRGWWTVEAAEFMSEHSHTLDLLMELMDGSLLRSEPRTEGDGERFTMLETVREFAREKMSTQEYDDFRDHHALWMTDCVQKVKTHRDHKTGMPQMESITVRTVFQIVALLTVDCI
jgi:predicted ATPase/DNA-binding SARP family transcriptional activator